MINGGFLFIGFIFLWIVYAIAKDYEHQAKAKYDEDDTQIKKNKKVGKKHV